MVGSPGGGASGDSPGARQTRRRRVSAPIWFATIALFIVSPVIASHSLDRSALLSMAPFASVLILASLGQMLVMQQGGLDLSVPGTISLAAVLVTQFPHGENGLLPVALVLALGSGLVAGTVNGLAVTWFKVTPLVATLGMNELLYGFTYQYTGGQLSATTTTGLSAFSSDTIMGIPHLALVAVLVVIVLGVLLRHSVVGRRLSLVGSNPEAGRASGLRIARYQVLTYASAGLLYSGAGILLAGYVRNPSLVTGDAYLLPTIVAVVLGGTALGGGRASAVGTAVGALFLQQLEQLLLTMGAAQSVQDLVQAGIVAAGLGLPRLPVLARLRRRRRADYPRSADQLPVSSPLMTNRQ